MAAISSTTSFRTGGNLAYRDNNYSPDLGDSMWEDCPLLAAIQDPAVGHLYFNDFNTYAAADWTITTVEAGAGSATEAITDEAGGVLLLTNAAGDNDSDNMQWVGEQYQLVASKPLWFEGRLKVSDATQHDLLFGLVVTDTTLITAPQDGVWFACDDGDTNIDYHADKDNTDTTGDTGIDLADNTYIRLGFKWNGSDTVTFYINGKIVASSTTNICNDELLRLSILHQNGEAVAKTMSIDWVKIFQVR